jgi:hypothetical protein
MVYSSEGFDIDPELTRRLGQIVIRWSALEAWISALVAATVGADPGPMQTITGTSGIKTQMDWIRNIISVHIDKEPELQEIVDLLARADELRADRNAIVHGIWDSTGCELGTAQVQTVRIERREIIRSELVTISDLDQLLIEINEWIAGYTELGRKFGFPRLSGSSKSIFTD